MFANPAETTRGFSGTSMCPSCQKPVTCVRARNCMATHQGQPTISSSFVGDKFATENCRDCSRPREGFQVRVPISFAGIDHHPSCLVVETQQAEGWNSGIPANFQFELSFQYFGVIDDCASIVFHKPATSFQRRCSVLAIGIFASRTWTTLQEVVPLSAVSR